MRLLNAVRWVQGNHRVQVVACGIWASLRDDSGALMGEDLGDRGGLAVDRANQVS